MDFTPEEIAKITVKTFPVATVICPTGFNGFPVSKGKMKEFKFGTRLENVRIVKSGSALFDYKKSTYIIPTMGLMGEGEPDKKKIDAIKKLDEQRKKVLTKRNQIIKTMRSINVKL